MRAVLERGSLIVVLALLSAGSASGQDLPKPLSDPASGREMFLAAAIVAMMLCGLLSFLLLGRASERTHVALAMLGMLIGGFGLLVLFGGALYDNPLVAIVVLLLLVVGFKFMSQFEAHRRSKRNRPKV